jgi:hypothetical protein
LTLISIKMMIEEAILSNSNDDLPKGERMTPLGANSSDNEVW